MCGEWHTGQPLGLHAHSPPTGAAERGDRDTPQYAEDGLRR